MKRVKIQNGFLIVPAKTLSRAVGCDRDETVQATPRGNANGIPGSHSRSIKIHKNDSIKMMKNCHP